MARAFSDIELEWQGKVYKLRHDMRAMRQIERVTMRPEVLADLQAYGMMTPADLAEVYAGLLNMAGCEVDAQDVYDGMFSVEADRGKIEQATAVIIGLLTSRTAAAPTVEEKPGANPQTPAPATS